MKKKRIAAIDYGLARIGVALSDPHKILASPLDTVPAQKKIEESVDAVMKRLEEYDLEEVVIGMPYKMNGQKGISADEVNEFIAIFKTKSSVPITAWDERLSTVQVERAMRDDNMRRKKRAKVVDKLCATLILQSYLETKKYSRVNQY